MATTDPAAQLAEAQAENQRLQAENQLLAARVARVEQAYGQLWRSVSEAANAMLAANHPLT